MTWATRMVKPGSSARGELENAWMSANTITPSATAVTRFFSMAMLVKLLPLMT